MAGLGSGSSDPFDGKIVRDENSQPNGILRASFIALQSMDTRGGNVPPLLERTGK
jgi:predicted amidohydrolase YtcJ